MERLGKVNVVGDCGWVRVEEGGGRKRLLEVGNEGVKRVKWTELMREKLRTKGKTVASEGAFNTKGLKESVFLICAYQAQLIEKERKSERGDGKIKTVKNREPIVFCKEVIRYLDLFVKAAGDSERGMVYLRLIENEENRLLRRTKAIKELIAETKKLKGETGEVLKKEERMQLVVEMEVAKLMVITKDVVFTIGTYLKNREYDSVCLGEKDTIKELDKWRKQKRCLFSREISGILMDCWEFYKKGFMGEEDLVDLLRECNTHIAVSYSWDYGDEIIRLMMGDNGLRAERYEEENSLREGICVEEESEYPYDLITVVASNLLDRIELGGLETYPRERLEKGMKKLSKRVGWWKKEVEGVQGRGYEKVKPYIDGVYSNVVAYLGTLEER